MLSDVKAGGQEESGRAADAVPNWESRGLLFRMGEKVGHPAWQVSFQRPRGAGTRPFFAQNAKRMGCPDSDLSAVKSLACPRGYVPLVPEFCAQSSPSMRM
jgi:hypothetical protein